MSDEKLVRVLLHNRGEDVETPWAEDLGPAAGGGRRVRLDNVPFLHAKPTFGDVVVAREDPHHDGHLAWDRDGVAWAQIGSRIDHDGGRYAMIVDYEVASVDRFGELSEWLGGHDVVPEGCFGPREDRPGRLYLAVPKSRAAGDVMALLAGNPHGFAFEQIHPEPARPAAAKQPAAKPPAKQPAAKPPAKQPAAKPPAAKQPAAKPPAAKPPAAKPPAAKKKAPAKAKGAAAKQPAAEAAAKKPAAKKVAAKKKAPAKAKSAAAKATKKRAS